MVDIGDVFDEQTIVVSIAYGILATTIDPEIFGQDFYNLAFISVIAVWYVDAWWEGNIRASGIVASIVVIIMAMQILDWLVGGDLSLNTLLFLGFIVVLKNTSRSPILIALWIANVVRQGLSGQATTIPIFPSSGGIKIIVDGIVSVIRDAITSFTSSQFVPSTVKDFVQGHLPNIARPDINFRTIGISIVLVILMSVWLIYNSSKKYGWSMTKLKRTTRKIESRYKKILKPKTKTRKRNRRKPKMFVVSAWKKLQLELKQADFLTQSIAAVILYTIVFIAAFMIGSYLSQFIDIPSLSIVAWW